MHPDLESFARRHGLSTDGLAELEVLWEDRGRSGSSTTADNFTSIDGTTVDDEAHAHPGREPKIPRIGGRYEDLGPIGRGGMGEVRRVRDVLLERTLAMKIVHERLLVRPATLARFVEEARATARLQHPNVVPVHDMGRMADGRIWFTMKEVRGRTLRDVITEVHAASPEHWEAGPSGWTFRRVMTAFHGVCRAVAFAHERRVVHRDLKPGNVMVGAQGEVYVLDWGLAKVVGRPDLAAEAGDPDLARSDRTTEGPTRVGQVAGTPAYMAPEQARGEVDRIDERSDVYALGAVLYDILRGRPPYEGLARSVLQEVVNGPPPPVGRAGGPPLPEELIAVCERAMAREPSERFPSATVLADNVQAWLDGVKRREQALQVTARAMARIATADAWVASAVEARAESVRALEGVAPWEAEERKAAAWEKAAEAEGAEQAGRLERLRVDQTLLAALQLAPDLAEAHVALVERYKERHAAAEATRDRGAAAEARALLELHAVALPERHEVRRAAAGWLDGRGALSLESDPPGAEVQLFRYVERNRRLVEVFERSLGSTPVRSAPLAMGSWLCVLRHPDREEVRYPVEVTRQGHWDGVPPGELDPRPVWMPPKGWLAPDEVYVPAGWFRAGGDPEALGQPAMRAWCDGLVIHRFPVTNTQYLVFLHDLVQRGAEEEALRHAPRERSGTSGEQGALIYGWDGRRFSLRPDADGDIWLPDWPIMHVDWSGARAYLQWLAARTGRPWRLPGELEWEKAARGVDGRAFPWGEHLDPSWCAMYDSHQGRRTPVVVDSYPVDVSPYGVRGLGGGVQDWCLDLADGPPSVIDGRVVPPSAAPDASPRDARNVRGGAWSAVTRYARSANRFRHLSAFRFATAGFRGLFRGGPPEDRPLASSVPVLDDPRSPR